MSKAEEFENKIREKRLLEATKKGLMGQNGKIAIVLKMMGEPIISQSEGGVYINSNYMDLENNNNEESINEISSANELLKKIPIMEIQQSQRPDTNEWASDMPDPINYTLDILGIHFDGLSKGMHLEIKYDEVTSELVVYYKGYVVYKEIKGELLSYAPIDEWEKWIEILYKKAKEKQRHVKEKEFEESIKQNEKEKNSWWDRVRTRWGIK